MADKASNKSRQITDDGLAFDEFPKADYQAWREEVEKTLKGTSFDKKMKLETYDDIILQPIYWPDDIADMPAVRSFPGFKPFLRGRDVLGHAVTPWQIVQEITMPLVTDLNRNLLRELESGQNAVIIKLDKAGRAGLDPDMVEPGEIGREGISISSPLDWELLFKDIDLDLTPIYMCAGLAAVPLAALFVSYLNKQSIDLSGLRGGFGVDPLHSLARTGALPYSIEHAYDEMAMLARWSIDNMPGFRVMSVDSSPYHESGGNAVQELALTLSTAVEYLKAMEKRGLAVERVASRMIFTFAIGPNFFTEIAKLRAFRMLWAKVIEACSVDSSPQIISIHARTSSYDKTCYDSHVNLLRTTTQALSAILGGCDSLEVDAFDKACKMPDNFSRHLARNIQLILREESHIDKIIDPAGGSWFIEKLTGQVAEKAWSIFQEIESSGGIYQSLTDGVPQKMIAETAAKRENNIAKRQDIIVGTNMYANPDENPLFHDESDYNKIEAQRLADLKRYRSAIDGKKKSAALAKLNQEISFDSAIAAAQNGATLGEIASGIRRPANEKSEIKPLRIHRAAEMFETIRNSVEVFKSKTGSALKVFLANVGESSDYKARADFASGFFEIGGFNVINGHGFKSHPRAAEAAINSQAAITVICSSDDNYSSMAGPLAQSIKKRKPGMLIILAGKPKDWEVYKQAGVADFIYPGCDARELLAKFARQIGAIA